LFCLVENKKCATRIQRFELLYQQLYQIHAIAHDIFIHALALQLQLSSAVHYIQSALLQQQVWNSCTPWEAHPGTSDTSQG